MFQWLITLTQIAARIAHLHVNSGYQPPSNPPSTEDKPSTLAVLTLMAGIGSWVILPLIGAFIGVLLGWIELSNIKKGQSAQAGKMITQIGFYLSVGQIAITIIGGCAFVALYLGLFGLIFGGAAVMENLPQ